MNWSVTNKPPHSTHIRCGTELNRPSLRSGCPARPIRTHCDHYTRTSNAWSQGQKLKPEYLDTVPLGLLQTNAYEKRVKENCVTFDIVLFLTKYDIFTFIQMRFIL